MNKILKVIFQLGIILLVGASSIWITSLITKEKSQEEIVKEIIKEVIIKRPSCPNTSDSFQELRNADQVVVLANNLNSYGENGYFVNKKFTIIKSTGSGSQIACGYLYIKVHASNMRPLQFKWEHPYIKSGQFGGHIDTNNSIIPIIDEKGIELLFNLNEINYRIKNNDPEVKKADLASLLNVSDQTKFEIALNTADKTGILEEVIIGYKCWNPETGQITNDCKLQVID